MIRSIEKTLSAFELVRNNSEKDKGKAELLSSVIDRLKVVETDLNRVSAEEGFDKLSSVPLDGNKFYWLDGYYISEDEEERHFSFIRSAYLLVRFQERL